MFSDSIGRYKGPRAKIVVDPQVKLRFCKVRPVPYAIREKVCDEIRRLVEEGILEGVEYSE